jgi:hypothetical protein
MASWCLGFATSYDSFNGLGISLVCTVAYVSPPHSGNLDECAKFQMEQLMSMWAEDLGWVLRLTWNEAFSLLELDGIQEPTYYG